MAQVLPVKAPLPGSEEHVRLQGLMTAFRAAYGVDPAVVVRAPGKHCAAAQLAPCQAGAAESLWHGWMGMPHASLSLHVTGPRIPASTADSLSGTKKGTGQPAPGQENAAAAAAM